MRVCRYVGALLFAAAASSFLGEARAQSSAAAEVLFREGRSLLTAGRTAEACAKFGSSYKLDPKTGTLLNLALCHEAEGKLATAWSEFGDVAKRASQTPGDERAAFAREQVAKLEPRLPRLVITAKEFPPDGELEIDGQRADSGVLGTPLPVDPGEHKLIAKAQARAPWETLVRAELGKTTQVHVPVLAALNVPASTRDTRPTAAPTPAPATTDSPASAATSAGIRPILGWTSLGVGVAALGLGSYFGLRTFSKKDEGDRECSGSLCSSKGLALHDEASQAALISTIAFGAGALGVGAGAYLLLTSKSSSASVTVTPLLAQERVGLGANGSF
jgi:hypothetical protein